MQYSIILPTFGRPDEVSNFLESITKQTYTNFEIVIVDGSLDNILHTVIDKYTKKVDLKYFHHKGLGASESRNLGCENAKGNFLVFIDSDCIVPADYMAKVDAFLKENTQVDAFGGPDAADKSFSDIQKAVNYAMTSFFTTGGIRGRKNHVGKFQLRGFNMGVKRQAFFDVGGYSGMQVAEDIDLSMRLIKAGYTTALITDAYVYHRRKAGYKIFFKQMVFHGKGRIDLHIKHGDALKLVHMLPAFFILYVLGGSATAFFSPFLFVLFYISLATYILAILVDSTIKNQSFKVGLMSIVTALEMHIAYGFGVWRNIVLRLVLKRGTDSIKSVELKK